MATTGTLLLTFECFLLDTTNTPDNYVNKIFILFYSECGCKEYAPLCKTCGMCSTCVNTIGVSILLKLMFTTHTSVCVTHTKCFVDWTSNKLFLRWQSVS